MDILPGYTAAIGGAGVSLAPPRVRRVFSESVKDIQLGNGGPPGRPAFSGGREVGWRAVTRVLRSPHRMLDQALTDLANLFLPSTCRVCGAALVQRTKVRVCEVCVGRLALSEDAEVNPSCTRCGDALGMESARFGASMGITECTMCRLAPPEFDRAVAFGNYDSEMREMLHLLKFGGLRGVAEHVLGEGMAEAVRKLRSAAAGDLVVVPVPLFSAKKRERGFNQATLLAVAALRRLRRLEPAWQLRLREDVLERVKDTRALYALGPSQRRHSLRGAFRVRDASAVRGREVLLIDDIMTTGATSRECARVLKRAGAAKVWVATAAKAQPESVREFAQHASRSSRPAMEMVALWDAPASPAGPQPGRSRL